MRKITGFAIEKPGLNYSETINLLEEEYRAIPQGKSIEIVEILGQQAEGLRRLSQLQESQKLFNRALFIAKKADIAWGECWSLLGLGLVLRARGTYNLCAKIFRSCFLAATHARDKRCALWARAELSELDRIVGNLWQALEAHKNLRCEFHAIGDWKGVCWATLGIGQIFRIQRELMGAVAEFKKAQDLCSTAGDLIGAAWAVRGLAEVAKENGDSLLAIELALDARAQFFSLGYKLGAAYSLKTQVEALLCESRLEEALSMAMQCRDEFIDCGERRGVGFSLLTLGSVWSRIGEPFHAIPILQRSRYLIGSSGGKEPKGFSPSAEFGRVAARLGCINQSDFSSLFSIEAHYKKTEQSGALDGHSAALHGRK